MGKRSVTEETQLVTSSAHDDVMHLDINQAIETVGCGWSTLFMTIGPFMLFALEGAELVMLSIIGLMVRCEWNLNTTQVAFLQVSVWIGMFTSATFLSGLGDVWGRRPVCILGATGVTVTGVVCALAVQYWQLVVLRIVVGFFVGISFGPCTALLAEIAPVKYRGMLIMINGFGWGIGTSLCSGIAYIVIEPFGWRGLFIATALLFSPSILVMSLAKESPRFHVKMKNFAEAEKTINFLGRGNGCESTIKLVQNPGESEGMKTICDGFKVVKEQGRVIKFIAQLFLTMFAMYVYYIFTYSMPRFLNEGYCEAVPKSSEESCVFDKAVLFELGMIGLFEPVAIAISIILLETLGRVKTFFGVLVLIFLCTSGLYFCVNPTYLVVILTLNKSFTAVVAMIPFITGSEFFPTEIRSFVMTISLGFTRIGATLGILFSQFIFNLGPRILVAFIQIGVFGIGASLSAFTKETMGQNLS